MGKLGMFEMELAAEKIVAIIGQHGIRQSFSVGRFSGEQEQNGFVELVSCGWLEHAGYNGCFRATPKLLERLGIEVPA